VNTVVVVGRDAPLWLAACVVQSALGPAGVRVKAVELPSLLRAHDVYATLPALEALHNQLRIDEATLLGRTRGAFSLGQNFVDALGATPAFFHAYGSYGAPIDNGAFFPYWLKARGFGLQVALQDFCLTAAAAKHGRMLIPDGATEIYGRADYAYHLPAIAYAGWMKAVAIQRGVEVHEAATVDVVRNLDNGDIAAVDIGEGRRIDGEFFIDATGAEARLIGAALAVQRESWRRYFPADRRLVSCGSRLASIPPYAEIRACGDGWVGLYPSQALTHVVQAYSSALCSDDQALQAAATVSGLSLRDAVVEVSDPGRCAIAWERNCVAVGEAACIFDPVHCVDLQAVQLSLVHLLSLFPVRSDCAAERAEYNRILRLAFERMRDFQSAHYVINCYAAAPFWSEARRAGAPAELTHKMETFRARGEVPLLENETFSLDSWRALFVGHGVLPETYDPMIDRTPPERMKQEFRRILGFIKDKVREQASHDGYLLRITGHSLSQ
jgi:tryptophan halogenase